MEFEDEEYQLTEDGLLQAIDMHQRLASGQTIEQVAAVYNLETTAIQIVLTMLYDLVDQFPGLVTTEVPDDVSSLD